nr:MAG TPA: hypothetical protein [Caudoviricetes sp.]
MNLLEYRHFICTTSTHSTSVILLPARFAGGMSRLQGMASLFFFI